jgi:hypothetical protein
MNARVFLLALVTAAFMGIWDADRPVNGHAAVAQSKLQPVGVRVANGVSNCSRLVAAKHTHTFQDNAAASESASATAHYEAVIPLPEKLQPGTWQVISRDGDAFHITIERNKSLSGSRFINSRRSESTLR